MPLPKMPKGYRHPGAGRKPGTPNKISVEVRQLVAQMMNDPVYQHQLREDFRRRNVHPTIEALIWSYHLGKPKQTVELNATVDVNARIEEEKRIFATLTIGQLEQLKAESEAIMQRAIAMSKGAATPLDIVVRPERAIEGAETLGKEAGSDNPSSDNQAQNGEQNLAGQEDSTK